MLHTLENHVRPLTALFEEALADGGLAPVPTSRAATPQRTKAGNYPFIELHRDDLKAVVGGLNGSGILRFDQARTLHALVLGQAILDDMNTALAAGGTVTIEFQMRSAISLGGGGRAAHAGRLITAVRHAMGGGTILESTPDQRTAPPGGTIDTPYVVTLTQQEVKLMAPGDTIYVAALAVGGAYAGFSDTIDQALLYYSSGRKPELMIRP